MRSILYTAALILLFATQAYSQGGQSEDQMREIARMMKIMDDMNLLPEQELAIQDMGRSIVAEILASPELEGADKGELIRTRYAELRSSNDALVGVDLTNEQVGAMVFFLDMATSGGSQFEADAFEQHRPENQVEDGADTEAMDSDIEAGIGVLMGAYEQAMNSDVLELMQKDLERQKEELESLQLEIDEKAERSKNSPPRIVDNNKSPTEKLSWMLWSGEGYSEKAVIDLIAAGVDINSRERDFYDQPIDTFLMMAVARGNLEIVNLMLQIGAGESINEVDEGGRTALMLASAANKTDDDIVTMNTVSLNSNWKEVQEEIWTQESTFRGIATALVQAGANVNATATNGETALYIAAVRDCYSIVGFLLSSGAEVNTGKNPLVDMCKLFFDQYRNVHQLIEAGIALDVPDQKGNTALMFSATTQSRYGTKLYTALVEAGANVEAVNKKGNTALHRLCLRGARRSGYSYIVKDLIASTTNLQITNNNGRTALDLASEYNRSLLGLFVDSGARYSQEMGSIIRAAVDGQWDALEEMLISGSGEVNATFGRPLLSAGSAEYNDFIANNKTALVYTFLYALSTSDQWVKGERYALKTSPQYTKGFRLCSLLLEKGADVHVPYNRKQTLYERCDPKIILAPTALREAHPERIPAFERTDKLRRLIREAGDGTGGEQEEEEEEGISSVIIQVHGVQSGHDEYETFKTDIWAADLKNTWLIPLDWGKAGILEASNSVGGRAQSVEGMSDRAWVGVAHLKQQVARVREVVGEGVEINILSHSQGTVITLAALLEDMKVNNWVLMGSPLGQDAVEDGVDNTCFGEGAKNVLASVYNFHSREDDIARLKSGVGRLGLPSTICGNPGNTRNVEVPNVDHISMDNILIKTEGWWGMKWMAVDYSKEFDRTILIKALDGREVTNLTQVQIGQLQQIASDAKKVPNLDDWYGDGDSDELKTTFVLTKGMRNGIYFDDKDKAIYQLECTKGAIEYRIRYAIGSLFKTGVEWTKLTSSDSETPSKTFDVPSRTDDATIFIEVRGAGEGISKMVVNFKAIDG